MEKAKAHFNNHIIMIGFGCIGQALLPLLINNLNIKPSQITVITSDDTSVHVAQKFGINFQGKTIKRDNYVEIIGNRLHPGDFVIDVSITLSSYCLLTLCEQKGALYINASTERWGDEFILENIPPESRTNYLLREEVLKLKGKTSNTALITHGANPGLVSHFVKQALLNMAQDNQIKIQTPKTSFDWARLAYKLGIKAIHIAEHDTQTALPVRAIGEFVNTWSIKGFIEEIRQPVEIGWGIHERHIPEGAKFHSVGPQCAIYLEHPSASVKVRSWTPSFGTYHGFLITHPETTSITHFLTLKNDTEVQYRPTVLYAYCPCPDAILSLHELYGNEWIPQENSRLLVDDVKQGVDELGVLLMGNPNGAYWFGSTLSIEQARALAPHNNATSLQVVAGLFAGIIWAIEHPNQGIVEPEELDHDEILKVALPYLGTVNGYYTDWNPLKNRGWLYSENVDVHDPWQFVNMQV
ncbi:homospermidine synthase [Legionella qingyii]|uniref:Homospermidine synthase n=1 Tax=Legionella qingyii TaxID=2184757 RepID=A0A317U062_9GAMM|nr:saccharopine dehydrogenase C-terminal domain-containing protein [Legionella qingyii]PWY55404.1 homospermidine synthase [Legionella qingyii]RUR21194.1 homospermidine synthase [Legionella qingyii]RUR24017.1 homospermidine synthase [Legionella qingyii]